MFSVEMWKNLWGDSIISLEKRVSWRLMQNLDNIKRLMFVQAQ